MIPFSKTDIFDVGIGFGVLGSAGTEGIFSSFNLFKHSLSEAKPHSLQLVGERTLLGVPSRWMYIKSFLGRICVTYITKQLHVSHDVLALSNGRMAYVNNNIQRISIKCCFFRCTLETWNKMSNVSSQDRSSDRIYFDLIVLQHRLHNTLLLLHYLVLIYSCFVISNKISQAFLFNLPDAYCFKSRTMQVSKNSSKSMSVRSRPDKLTDELFFISFTKCQWPNCSEVNHMHDGLCPIISEP